MAVRKSQRKVSGKESLQKARELVNYALILTKSSELKTNGKYSKPGILGDNQKFSLFGSEIFNCARRVHALCHKACYIRIKDKETWELKTKLFNQALSYCDTIFSDIDFCIYKYFSTNKQNMRKMEHLSKLTREIKRSIQERITKDKYIFLNYYNK